METTPTTVRMKCKTCGERSIGITNSVGIVANVPDGEWDHVAPGRWVHIPCGGGIR